MVSGFCFSRIFITHKAITDAPHTQKNILKFSWLLPSFLSLLLFGSSVKATAIANWHFDSNRNHLDLTTNENVQPKVQLLTNPTRLVIDLPGVTLGLSTDESKSGVSN
ncbi:AMIN domain-containing protein [Nostoc sp.]|uniref:AMIN domain-containing protein n=1 Tax=Nostoc sp. TaxID=1180 RepID=UPI002FFB012D